VADEKPNVCSRCGRKIDPGDEMEIARGPTRLGWDVMHQDCAAEAVMEHMLEGQGDLFGSEGGR
jgi:hypothetical protein